MINLIPKEEFGTHLLKKYNFGFTANSGRKKQ